MTHQKDKTLYGIFATKYFNATDDDDPDEVIIDPEEDDEEEEESEEVEIPFEPDLEEEE